MAIPGFDISDPENEDAPEDQSGDANQHKQSNDSTYRRKAIGFFAMLSSDLFGNPKIVEAGPHGTLVFIHALCRNAASGRTGSLSDTNFTPAYLSRQLGVTRDEALKAFYACLSAGLLSLDEDNGEVHICGWSEEWKRGPLTEAERIRKQEYRKRQDEKKREKEETRPKKGKRERGDTDKNRGVRDMSRTGSEGVWGLSPGERLRPSMTNDEERTAWSIIHAIGDYTGTRVSNGGERQHLVWLMRNGYPAWQLERLAAYMCDDNGAGWVNREDKDGHFYMRPHATVFGIFTAKNVRGNLSSAVAWTEPSYRFVEKDGKSEIQYYWSPRLHRTDQDQ